MQCQKCHKNRLTQKVVGHDCEMSCRDCGWLQKKPITYQMWLDIPAGQEAQMSAFISLAGMQPTKFELDKNIRLYFEDWKENGA